LAQREDGPANLDDALRTGDTDKVKVFRPFKGIAEHQLLSLVNLFLQVTRAPLVVGVRASARLDKLLPQLRGLAKSIGKGNVFLLLIRGRR
jgi:hypothetical protein